MHLDFAKRLLKLVAEEAPSQSVRDFLAANVDYQAHPSPLLAHWTYQAAIVVLRLNAQTGEDFGKVEHLTRRLEALGQRWFVAGMLSICHCQRGDLKSCSCVLANSTRPMIASTSIQAI